MSTSLIGLTLSFMMHSCLMFLKELRTVSTVRWIHEKKL